MRLTCSICGTDYTTVRSRPETWGHCKTGQRFTVAPATDKTKFATAKKETSA